MIGRRLAGRARAWIILLALAWGLGACQSEPAYPGPPVRTTWFTSERYGISFEIADGWTHEQRGSSHIFSGPQSEPTYYTTLTIQGVPGPEASLEQHLEQALAPLIKLPGFAWERRDPALVDGHRAVRYAVHFDLHEQPRRKEGVFVETTRGVVDVSYAAPTEMFHQGLHVFHEVLESLWVY